MRSCSLAPTAAKRVLGRKFEIQKAVGILVLVVNLRDHGARVDERAIVDEEKQRLLLRLRVVAVAAVAAHAMLLDLGEKRAGRHVGGRQKLRL